MLLCFEKLQPRKLIQYWAWTSSVLLALADLPSWISVFVCCLLYTSSLSPSSSIFHPPSSNFIIHHGLISVVIIPLLFSLLHHSFKIVASSLYLSSDAYFPPFSRQPSSTSFPKPCLPNLVSQCMSLWRSSPLLGVQHRSKYSPLSLSMLTTKHLLVGLASMGLTSWYSEVRSDSITWCLVSFAV